MQAGARRYPVPPFPKVHQRNPIRSGPSLGSDVRCAFLPGLREIEGQGGADHGGDLGIGRSVAILFAREGADVAIVHLDEVQDAGDTKAAVEKEGRGA